MPSLDSSPGSGEIQRAVRGNAIDHSAIRAVPALGEAVNKDVKRKYPYDCEKYLDYF